MSHTEDSTPDIRSPPGKSKILHFSVDRTPDRLSPFHRNYSFIPQSNLNHTIYFGCIFTDTLIHT